MAQSHDLSSSFTQKHRAFPSNDNERANCLQLGRPVLEPNLQELPTPGEYHRSLLAENIQAYADFPLNTPEGQIGYLSVYFDETQTFPAEEVELLQTFATQAALAIANANLYTQTDRALSRRAEQIKILELVGQQLSTTLRSDEFFGLVLEYARDFTHSPWGALIVHDPIEDEYEIKAQSGYIVDSTKFSTMKGIAGRVIREKKANIINDVSQDPDFHDITGGKTASQLTVPITHNERAMGVITLESPELYKYTENELSFVSQLADQAALAIINAELYEETQHRLREQATLFLISSRLVSNQELESVLNAVVQAFSASLDNPLTGLYLWDPNNNIFHLRAIMEREHETQAELPTTISAEQWQLFQKYKKTTGPLQVTEENIELAQSLKIHPDYQTLVFNLNRGGQNIGLILAHLPADQILVESELQLPKTIAVQSATAIQNALLFSDVSQGRDRLEAVLDSVGEGVLMIDANGVVTLANNPIEIFTNSPIEEIIGKRFEELSKNVLGALGFKRTEAKDLVKNTLGHPQTERAHKHNYKHGERFLERSSAPVRDTNNLVLGWVIVIRDVTHSGITSRCDY
jgi:PAS domain S-box-containing protein